jgi:tRNA dimethylallyltransferase
MNPFVLIVGQTASGKSSLGLRLAEHFGGAILNCDSVQTYQRLNIGTAKPSAEDFARVKHFLFDLVKPGEVLTAGDYRRAAMEVLARELPSRMLFGVGGSGFYIQALEKGMFDVPKPSVESERRVRRRLEEKGPAAMYAELKAKDPEYAEAVSPNDTYRVTRALIIIEDSGKSVTQVRREFAAIAFPYPLIKFGLNLSREELEPRVRERAKIMLAEGLLEEVRTLVNEGLGRWPAMQSVGYKECLDVINGDLPEAKLFDQIVEKTLQLSKKQRTWFKRDTEILWLTSQKAFDEAV